MVRQNAACSRAHLGYRYGYCAHSTAHPSALAELSVIIDADGKTAGSRATAGPIIALAVAKSNRAHTSVWCSRAGRCRIPDSVKLQGGGDKIETLIINAAEASRTLPPMTV